VVCSAVTSRGFALMRIMTLNLRFPNPKDGNNFWYVRKKSVVKLIISYSPDLLATQEGTLAQLNYLARELPDYSLFSEGRVWDERCQYPSIFYRKSQITACDGGEFWLSKTPGVHLSKDWDSAFPRMLSFMRAKKSGSGKLFWFATTHLDNISSEARIKQAEIIREWIEKRQDPVILAGDFNDVPGSEAYKILVKPTGPLLDSWKLLDKPENGKSLTHHGFTGVPQWGRLDWILLDENFNAVDGDLVREEIDGRYPSDHFPYWVDIDIV